MKSDRRILSPMSASVAAALLVGAATLGGSVSSDRPAVKTDRFATLGDTLCAGQDWPNLSNECLAWTQGEVSNQSIRFVTVAENNIEASTTTLVRMRSAPVN